MWVTNRLLEIDIKTKLWVIKTFQNDLVAMHKKSKVTFTPDQQAYIGTYMLDLSKVLMDKFRYNYIRNKYGNNSRLLLTFHW